MHSRICTKIGVVLMLFALFIPAFREDLESSFGVSMSKATILIKTIPGFFIIIDIALILIFWLLGTAKLFYIASVVTSVFITITFLSEALKGDYKEIVIGGYILLIGLFLFITGLMSCAVNGAIVEKTKVEGTKNVIAVMLVVVFNIIFILCLNVPNGSKSSNSSNSEWECPICQRDFYGDPSNMHSITMTGMCSNC